MNTEIKEEGRVVSHPAVYTDLFIPKFAEILAGMGNVLDIFAGTGKIAKIKEHGFGGKIICNEIEPEWAVCSRFPVDEWHIGDAANMTWAKTESIESICTSPTYGNRMADHFNAKDNSRRITYRHTLGRELNRQNTGRMQWGESYRKKHIEVYGECIRVLKPNGLMIVNVSNHIRAGSEIMVVDWHKDALCASGFTFINQIEIETPRMKFGQNHKTRVSTESILVYKKHS